MTGDRESGPRGAGGRTALGLGVGIVLLYLGMALATASWAPGRLRPLFDGFGSHAGVYNWVNPPKEFAEGNLPPEAAQARIGFDASGSSPATAETPDGLAMVSLPRGAVPARPADAAARIDLRPVDSTTLGPLPAGLRPEGNAYQVRITYLPSDAPATTVTTAGTVGVTSEAPADTLLFSVDGQGWRRVEAKPLADGKGFTAPFTEAGFYLAAGPGALRAAVDSGGGPPVALFVVAAAVPLVLGYLLLGRRRPPATRPAAGRRAPARPGGSQKTNEKKKKKKKKRR